MYDRLQQQDRQRQQQQLEEMQIPGRQPSPLLPLPPAAPPATQCFVITHISLRTLDPAPVPFGRWFTRLIKEAQGQCLDITGIQALQTRLSNALIDHGYVTSRVMVPEQDIKDAQLELLVLVGRIGDIKASGMSPRLLRWALPKGEDEPVNLRDLEQAVENLSRLPGLVPSMDLAPGTTQGKTTVVGKAEQARRYRAYLVVDEEHDKINTHGTAQLGAELASPFGVTDRLSASLNSDLDTTFSDQAWGASLGYDISRGYWNLALSHSRQQYRNQVSGIFQHWLAEGLTQTSRLDITRTLHRSAKARLDATLFGSYADVENQLERATIRVSSYQLRTVGGRFSGKYLWGQTLLSGTLTAEEGWGTGPATHLPGNLSIAHKQHARYQAAFNASRFIRPLYGQLSLRLNTQYTQALLFPSERFSVASSSMVRGYRHLALSGNSATAGSLQLDVYPPWPLPVSLVPFVAYDSGVVPGNSNETGFARLDSTTIGFSLGYRALQFKTDISWPIKRYSTDTTDSRYTLHASLYAQY